jgi:hypothetical protein
MAKDSELYKVSQSLVDEYLKKGGKITVLKFGEKTDPDQIQNSWGHKGKKKAEPKQS